MLSQAVNCSTINELVRQFSTLPWYRFMSSSPHIDMKTAEILLKEVFRFGLHDMMTEVEELKISLQHRPPNSFLSVLLISFMVGIIFPILVFEVFLGGEEKDQKDIEDIIQLREKLTTTQNELETVKRKVNCFRVNLVTLQMLFQKLKKILLKYYKSQRLNHHPSIICLVNVVRIPGGDLKKDFNLFVYSFCLFHMNIGCFHLN